MTISKELKEKILNNFLSEWVWSKVGVWDKNQRKNVKYDSFYNPVLKEGVDGRLLTEEDMREVKEAIKKAKSEKMLENKNKVLNNLSKWSIDPLGALVDAEELKKRTYESFDQYWFEHLPKLYVNQDVYQQEIYPAMINDIKQHASEWKIEPEGKKLTIVKHISGRKHYKEGFAPREWAEVEKIISQSRQQQQAQQVESLTQETANWLPFRGDNSGK